MPVPTRLTETGFVGADIICPIFCTFLTGRRGRRPLHTRLNLFCMARRLRRADILLYLTVCRKRHTLQEDLNIPIDLGLSVCCHLIRHFLTKMPPFFSENGHPFVANATFPLTGESPQREG